ncbi:MAG TPA: APC family permease [Steroidobacteraceae bacterium]|nr:APC family permease [Steroidobacteraceae bacterium]
MDDTSAEAPRPLAPAGRLRRESLGVIAVTFFVVSAAGPLVAMAGGIPVAMLFGNGAGTPALFLAAMLILCLFSVGYTAMARHVQDAGAFYAFARRGLGERAGGATALVALLSYNALQISLYGMLGSALNELLMPILHRRLAWWVYALAVLAVIASLGYRRVDLSARILGVLVACEYLVVLVLDWGIVMHGGAGGLNVRPFLPSTFATGAPWTGLMLCFSAFLGFEATTIYSEEARNPARTIPIATYCSVLLIGAFYTLSTWAVVIGAGVDATLPMLNQLGDPTRLLFVLSDHYVGPLLSQAMRVLFVTSIFAGLLAFHNAIARYLYATGRDRLLPSVLGKTHRRFQSPHVGSIVQTLLAFVSVALFAACGADPILTVFTLPSAVATLGIIALMAAVSAATLRYFHRRADSGVLVRMSAWAALFALAAVAILAAVHFDVLAGTPLLTVRLLPLSLPITALAGAALARRMLRTPGSLAEQSAQPGA